MTFNPAEKRDSHGRWTAALIYKSDLSTPDARRSREVSPEEFQKIAAKGAVKFAAMKRESTPATGLGAKQMSHAFAASRKPWGGVTIDAHTGEEVAPNADAYALTIRKPNQRTVSVGPKANGRAFMHAWNLAKERFAEQLSQPGAHLGVFHDADLKRIDIDPVLVTPSLQDVEEIGAFTHAVGGAYHFKSGDGYWPPHVADPMGLDSYQRTRVGILR